MNDGWRSGLRAIWIAGAKVPVVGGMTLLALIGAFFALHHTAPPSGVGPKSGPPSVLLPAGGYVALGDSYSAGEGLDPYEPATEDPARGGNDCHRSPRAYTRILEHAERLSATVRTCSGAETQDLLSRSQKDEGPQILPGTLADTTTLVTITIGGNDMEFSNVLAYCAQESNCPFQFAPKFSPEPGHGVADLLQTWAAYHLDDLHATLRSIYDEIRARSPMARVLVLGYPHLFAPAHTDEGGCGTIYQQIDADERAWLNGSADALNGTIALAAAESGVEYVDLASLFSGHEPCASGGPWLNPLVLHGLKTPDRGSFHPNAAGQQWMARIVACHLLESSAPFTRTSVPPPRAPFDPHPPALPAAPPGPSAEVTRCVGAPSTR